LLYVFTCLYNYTDIVLCTAYFVLVFVLTFPHPGLYWIYGNKDDDDDDDPIIEFQLQLSNSMELSTMRTATSCFAAQ
jgi:hypothetical protein